MNTEKITELKPGENDLGEVATWGVLSVKAFAQALEGHLRGKTDLVESDEIVIYLFNEIKHKLDDVNDKIFEYDTYQRELENRLHAQAQEATG